MVTSSNVLSLHVLLLAALFAVLFRSKRLPRISYSSGGSSPDRDFLYCVVPACAAAARAVCCCVLQQACATHLIQEWRQLP
jgi:hypothetical protein